MKDKEVRKEVLKDGRNEGWEEGRMERMEG